MLLLFQRVNCILENVIAVGLACRELLFETLTNLASSRPESRDPHLANRGQYFVYILSNKLWGNLYVGMTNNLARRVTEHRAGLGKHCTAKYGLTRLVYFEIHEAPCEAIRREKQIKHWRRSWKLKLIKDNNPKWEDLYVQVLQG